jgi:hypothetical protein
MLPRRGGAATILQQRPRTILVLGGGDAGKTSYCRFLIAQLLGAGERPAVIDADVGQKMVGPPATATLGYAEGMAEQWTAAAEAFHFVGSTGPAIARHLLQADKPLAAICRGPQLLIATGLMAGRTAACYRAVRQELEAAGANYLDREVVVVRR